MLVSISHSQGMLLILQLTAIVNFAEISFYSDDWDNSPKKSFLEDQTLSYDGIFDYKWTENVAPKCPFICAKISKRKKKMLFKLTKNLNMYKS